MKNNQNQNQNNNQNQTTTQNQNQTHNHNQNTRGSRTDRPPAGEDAGGPCFSIPRRGCLFCQS